MSEYSGIDPLANKEVAVSDDPVGETHRERLSKQKLDINNFFRPLSRYKNIDKEGKKYRKERKKTLSEGGNIKRWLSSDEIEKLVKENSNFNKYYWSRDNGKTWEDMYPFVRPDVGWWMTKKLSDYTVKISFDAMSASSHGWNNGTGWFLDFEEPEKGKYPTKWFIATNAHVIDWFRFGKKNYESNIPIGCLSVWWSWECKINHEMILYKDALMVDKWLPKERDPFEVWNEKSNGIPNWSLNTKVDRLIDAGENVDPLDIPVSQHPVFGARVQNPKFTYFASNYMESPNSKSRNYALDVAIFEVEFKDELSARRMTNNLYDKYYKEGAKWTPLNFLNENTDLNFMESLNRKESFFSVGYAKNTLSNLRVMGNYSNISKTAGIPGSRTKFCNNCDYNNIWWGDRYWRPDSDSSAYWFSQFWAGAGSSGSLVVDIDGNAIGLVTSGIEGGDVSLIVPLRNMDVVLQRVNKKNKWVSRGKRYDLISGFADRETHSYKDVILKNHLKTHLSVMGKWNLNEAVT